MSEIRTGRKHLRLWLVALLIAVPTVVRADTITAADYQKQLQHAIDELVYLQKISETSSDYDYHVQLDQAIHTIEETLPEQESVKASDDVCNVDNLWLRVELNGLKTASPEERATRLAQVTKRLEAIEERVSYLQQPATANENKVHTKAKLESILARPEYATEARGQNALNRLIQGFIRWIMAHLPRFQVKPGGPSWVGTVAQVLVLLVALVVIFYVLKTLWARFYRTRQKRVPKKREARIVLGERLEPEATSTDLLSEAEALARAGDIRAAIRKAYIALLVELGDRKVIALAQHKTNRDYLNAVRTIPVLHPTMRALTESFEQHWYGFVEATDGDWQNFRSRYQAALQTQN